MKTHFMKLNPAPMKMFQLGHKTIELRLYDEKRKKIFVGDKIIFINIQDVTDTLSVIVEDLFVFDSFDELYKSLPLLECGYTQDNIDKASPCDMERYYPKEKQNKYGVIGIKVSMMKK